MEDLDKTLNKTLQHETNCPVVRLAKDTTKRNDWVVKMYYGDGWNTLYKGTKPQCMKFMEGMR
jgi:hypothetical protein